MDVNHIPKINSETGYQDEEKSSLGRIGTL